MRSKCKDVKISIITPVFNGEVFIENCLKNVIEQKCPFAEHLIMDGGSKDKTVEILKTYSQKHPHIHFISEKDNGQSDAMNKGIKMAKGDIISFLNVDDFYEPNALNDAAAIIDKMTEPGLLVGNCKVWISEDKIQRVNKPKHLKLRDLLLGVEINEHPINPSAYFYHKSLHEKIGYYKIDEHFAMDIDFIYRAVQYAHVKYVDKIWGNFRSYNDTKTVLDYKSGNGWRRLEAMQRFYRKDLSFLDRLWVTAVFETRKKIQSVAYFLKNPLELINRLKYEK
ncbi:glycosyl transferase family 2 [Chloroherpeton thalassium ATCC 35110]|uniref:Glycosyl transferase family 2 n=1 Tax=Chloroherpeton thalassium (strain ATCC 35110 / GB-78) TaxID=517418 RepID=B3QXP5_CHLT3|nr:glycosyltransferase family 2 protein [Chloroherpeton thalassium]ACF14960.1 glycosyl transferase family 2 [Chloroherpeton thalassium ATCC 35110]